jgi:radical SAM protein with 4Fe4S-binding SPASM domain
MDPSTFPYFPLRVDKDGAYSFLDPADNSVHDLNYSAARILELCDGAHSLAEVMGMADAVADREEAESFIREVSGEGLLIWRRARAAAVGPPQTPGTVFWDLTYACNLACIHCYNMPSAGKRDELSTAEAVRVLEELYAAGVGEVALGGGEPLLRADLPVVLGAARDLGFRSLSIATNGTLADREKARVLKETGCDVQVSLDGSRAELHDDMRGVPGAFDKAVEGIRTLQEADIDVSVCTTVTTRNVESVPDILELMKDLGVSRYRVQGVVPIGRGRDNAADIVLPPERMREVALFLRERSIHVSGYDFTLREPQCGPVDFHGSAACSAATGSCAITADGRVVPCSYFTCFNGESLREHTFKWIWDNSPLLNYVRSATLDEIKGHCRDCRWLGECHGGCKIINYVNGDMFGSLNDCWVDPRRRAEGAACR